MSGIWAHSTFGQPHTVDIGVLQASAARQFDHSREIAADNTSSEYNSAVAAASTARVFAVPCSTGAASYQQLISYRYSGMQLVKEAKQHVLSSPPHIIYHVLNQQLLLLAVWSSTVAGRCPGLPQANETALPPAPEGVANSSVNWDPACDGSLIGSVCLGTCVGGTASSNCTASGWGPPTGSCTCEKQCSKGRAMQRPLDCLFVDCFPVLQTTCCRDMTAGSPAAPVMNG